MISRYFFALCICIVCGFYTCTATLADNVTYIVDPAQSTLTLSGTFAGEPLQSQSGIPDSLVTSITGAIAANRDMIANTFQITGGSISAQTNDSQSLLGIGNGIAGYSFPPADYGFSTKSPLALTGALLDFAFSLSSPLISAPAAFDASLISAIVSSGEIQYFDFQPGPMGGEFLGGNLALASAPATLTETGVGTLTIPVNADFSLLAYNQPLNLHFSGEIVASEAAPEPNSFLVLAIPMLLTFYKNRRFAK